MVKEQREPLAQRSCGPCRMCCYVFAVPQVPRNHLETCKHLTDGGCAIYASRPGPCREFHCEWRYDSALDDAWRPDVAGFVLSQTQPWALLITETDKQPGAWRREPYYTAIKERAQTILAERGGVIGVDRPDGMLILAGEKEMPMSEWM